MKELFCYDCGAFPDCPQLTDEVWLTIANSKDLLCMFCAEGRLNRQLTLHDLAQCRANKPIRLFVMRERKALANP